MDGYKDGVPNLPASATACLERLSRFMSIGSTDSTHLDNFGNMLNGIQVLHCFALTIRRREMKSHGL